MSRFLFGYDDFARFGKDIQTDMLELYGNRHLSRNNAAEAIRTLKDYSTGSNEENEMYGCAFERICCNSNERNYISGVECAIRECVQNNLINPINRTEAIETINMLAEYGEHGQYPNDIQSYTVGFALIKLYEITGIYEIINFWKIAEEKRWRIKN